MRSAILAGAAMVLSLAGARAAAAAVYTATWTGHVADGVDYSGFFGAPGADMTGAAFTAVVTLDPNAPGSYRFSTPTRDDLDGLGMSSPVKAVLSLAGTTVLFDPTPYPAGFGTDFRLDDGGDCAVSCYHAFGDSIVPYSNFTYPDDTDTSHYHYETSDLVLVAFDYAGYVSSLAHGPTADLASAPGLSLIGAFDLENYDYDLNTNTITGGYLTHLNLVADRVTWSGRAGGAPEPAAWALMIGGFGVAGTSLRRRRRQHS